MEPADDRIAALESRLAELEKLDDRCRASS
jgi:hypothetical protein